ncbi:MAG: phosphatase PAP2 family protein [Solirubrobacterales bacterium]
MAKSYREPLLACLACAAALGLLTILVFESGSFNHADASLLHRLLVERESSSFDLARALARLADPLAMVAGLAAVCGLALRWGRRREALAAVAVVLGANLTTQALKHLLDLHRSQPFLDVFQPWHDAFPSGHTTAAVSLAVALVLVAPARHRALAVAIGALYSALIALCVLVLEWHYPSDVVAGALVAVGWGCAALAALRFLARERAAGEAQASSRFAISTK